NVTGYALGRLHAGAFGSLGVITEVTLRLAPRPESHAPYESTYDEPLAAVRDGLRVARQAPALGFVGLSVNGDGARLVWVHEGDREWVDEGRAWSERALGVPGARDGEDPSSAIERRLGLRSIEHVCPRPANVLLRGNVLASRLPSLVEE